MPSRRTVRVARIRILTSLAALVIAALVAAPGPAAAVGDDTWTIEILSRAPDQVSGNDARVRVGFPGDEIVVEARLFLNGVNVTDFLAPQGDDLVGVVEGFTVGQNLLQPRPSRKSRRVRAQLAVVNHPIGGPIFSGPQQQPFVCTTARVGLGQPIIDNQDMIGIPVAQEDASGNYPRDGRGYPTAAATIIGWSKDCAANRRFDYQYRTTAGAV